MSLPKPIELPYLVKPRLWEPCNGCGWCCAVDVCEIGKFLHGDIKGPCPSLIYEDGRTYCGAVKSHPLGEVFAEMLGIGRGCCSDDP